MIVLVDNARNPASVAADITVAAAADIEVAISCERRANYEQSSMASAAPVQQRSERLHSERRTEWGSAPRLGRKVRGITL